MIILLNSETYPLQQGLRSNVIDNRIVVRLLRNMLPVKQGLRFDHIQEIVGHNAPQRPTSNKTRIKTLIIPALSFSSFTSPRPTSIKTRIKTD